MDFRWDPLKSQELKRKRGVSFEDILSALFVTARSHPGRPNQKLLFFELDDYIWVVPCVKRGDELFLKTIFPSRKHTKQWKEGELG